VPPRVFDLSRRSTGQDDASVGISSVVCREFESGTQARHVHDSARSPAFGPERPINVYGPCQSVIAAAAASSLSSMARPLDHEQYLGLDTYPRRLNKHSLHFPQRLVVGPGIRPAVRGTDQMVMRVPDRR